MMLSRKIIFSLIIILLSPTLSFANVGVPMVFIGLPFAIAGLIPIILIECWVIRRNFKIDFKTNLKGVAAANFVSTLVGYPVAWVLQMIVQIVISLFAVSLTSVLPPSLLQNTFFGTIVFALSAAWLAPSESSYWWMIPVAGMAGLVPAFLISVRMEAFIQSLLWRKLDRSAIRFATYRANIASYLFLLLVLIVILARNFQTLDPTVWEFTKLGINVDSHNREITINLLNGSDVAKIIEQSPFSPEVKSIRFGRASVHSKLKGIEKFPNVNTLSLDQTDIQDTDFVDLAPLKNVEVLHLENTKITGAGFSSLKDWNALSQLELRESSIEDQFLGNLQNFPKLNRIDLSDTHVTGKGLENLPSLSELQFISLDNTPLTDDGLLNLGQHRSLEWVVIGDTSITDRGIEVMKELKNVKQLHMCDTKVTDQGLASLAQLSKLETLSICNDPYTDAGLVHLKGLTKLNVIDLNGSNVRGAGLTEFEGMKSLNRVWLKNTPVSKEAVTKLKTALPAVDIFHNDFLE